MLDQTGFKQSILLFLVPVIVTGLLVGKTLNVGPGSTYKSISAAITVADPYDTLFIAEGLYFENDIKIKTPLYIIGNKAVIDAREAGQIMTVSSDFVSITGVTFQNSGVSFIEDISALKLDRVQDGEVKDCTFINNFFALYLAESTGITVHNNTILGQSTSESRSGNGIHLWYCKNIDIESNSVSGHRDGIYLEFVENSLIQNNNSFKNLRYGLHFMFSNRNSYLQNRFIANGSGTAVMYSRHVNMVENEFSDNLGSAAYGILIKDIYDSTIHDNIIRGNSVGLYSEASNRVSVQRNIFEKNGWAVKVMANSMDNTFSSNIFLNNSFDVATNSRQNYNIFTKNYYSKYRGYDLNRDGFGDVPYRPVKLFSFLVEKNEPILIFLNSAFVDLLNLAETVLPVLVPETLVDEDPLMVMP